ISEIYAFPQLMKRLLRDREMLGLRNIILLGSPMGGEFAIPALELLRNANRELFAELPGGLLMEDLLKKYEAFPISYGEGITNHVLHTTGTVSGMHKPVPLTDKAMNAFVVSAIKAKDIYDDFKKAPEHMISYLSLNMSWVYAMVDMLHTPLGMGMEVVALPMGATNPRYSEAIEHYGIGILFTSKSILDSWLKTMPDINLSKLKVVFMGGTYVSPEYKQKFNDYLRSCGSPARIINGYGLSELGGACIIAPSS
ncbi:MAG: AMP-binding protein, partial [Lachnospiraceae bacterium]|nr:AMP-binding protein [Lachnospiraceae bacterium]